MVEGIVSVHCTKNNKNLSHLGTIKVYKLHSGILLHGNSLFKTFNIIIFINLIDQLLSGTLGVDNTFSVYIKSYL